MIKRPKAVWPQIHIVGPMREGIGIFTDSLFQRGNFGGDTMTVWKYREPTPWWAVPLLYTTERALTTNTTTTPWILPRCEHCYCKRVLSLGTFAAVSVRIPGLYLVRREGFEPSLKRF